MPGLAELLDLEPLNIPQESYYAPVLQGLGNNLSNTQIPFKGVDLSGGERFLLEAGKGLGGTISSVLGNQMAAQAQAQMQAQAQAQKVKELLLTRALEEQDLAKKQDFELQKEALSQGYLRPVLDQETGRVSLSEALGSGVAPSLEGLNLSSEETAVLSALPPREQMKEASILLREKTKQKAIDARQEKAGKKDWYGAMGIDQKNQTAEAPKVGKEGLALAEQLKTLIPKYNAAEWWLSKDINGTDAQRANAALMFWAQKATKLVDKGALTEGDKKTLQEIASGKGTWFARPSTLYPFLEDVNKRLILGTTNQLRSSKTAYEQGGDALLKELEGLAGAMGSLEPQTGNNLMNRSGVELNIPNGMKLQKNRKTGETRLVPQ